MTLGVEVDEKDTLAKLRECSAKVDGGGRLANTTFLHGDGDRSGQSAPSLTEGGLDRRSGLVTQSATSRMAPVFGLPAPAVPASGPSQVRL